MTPETFCEHFATFAEAPNGVAKLRELILQLAVQGKLGTQDVNDEPASVLRAKISAKRKRLIENGEFTAFATDTEWPNGALPYSLPNGWEWIRLGELGGFLGGGTPSKERAEFWDGKIPWVSPKDMKRPYMDDAIDHVSPLGVENSSGKLIPKGSLLMVVRGMILAHSFPVALAMRELTINQDMKAMQLALPELGEYMLRCCAACKSRMLESVERSSHGTCRLPTEAVANFPIPLPSLAEQRRIVGKVDQLLGLCDELAARQAARREARERLVGATLDRLVSARSAAEFPAHAQRLRDHFDRLFDTPTTLPQLRQAILQLAVQGQLVPQDPNDEPASALIERIEKRKSELIRQALIPKQSALPPVQEDKLPFSIPRGWQWIRLESVCEIITKGSSPTWQGVQYVDADNGVLFVTSENVGNYVLRKMDEPKYVERKFNEMEPRSILQRDDLLVNLVGGSIGRSAIFDRDDVANINQAVGIIRLVRGDIAIDRWYLLHYLNSPISLQIMFAEQVETARANLSLTNMKQFLVPVPPLSEQKRIVSKVTELLSLCDALEAKLTQAESASTQLLSAAVHHLLQTN